MIFGGWTGMQRFLGGPLPAWMTAVGSAATIFILLPVITVGLSYHLTTRGNLGYMKYSPTLRFTVFGAWGLNVFAGFAVLMSLFSVTRFLQFTHAVTGLEMAALYGFFSMVMFGAFYFIAPRVTGCEWLTGGMIRFHFWFSAYGIMTLVFFMFVGGVAQGYGLDRWDADFRVSVERGFGYLVARSLAWGFIVLSNLMFLFHTLLMSVRLGRSATTGPTLIHKLPSGKGMDMTEGAKA
jgi:cytochrome c oxidase cbb3-type subunit 1